MTVKGALIAALAAGYIATVAPSPANAGDGEKAKTDKAEKASCKGKGGCKGDKKKTTKKEGEKAEGEKAEGEKAAPPK